MSLLLRLPPARCARTADLALAGCPRRRPGRPQVKPHQHHPLPPPTAIGSGRYLQVERHPSQCGHHGHWHAALTRSLRLPMPLSVVHTAPSTATGSLTVAVRTFKGLIGGSESGIIGRSATASGPTRSAANRHNTGKRPSDHWQRVRVAEGRSTAGLRQRQQEQLQIAPATWRRGVSHHVRSRYNLKTGVPLAYGEGLTQGYTIPTTVLLYASCPTIYNDRWHQLKPWQIEPKTDTESQSLL